MRHPSTVGVARPIMASPQKLESIHYLCINKWRLLKAEVGAGSDLAFHI